MRDYEMDEDVALRPNFNFSLLYIDLQRIQDRNILRDRHLTAVSLGLPTTFKTVTNVTNELARSASAMLERRLSVVSFAESLCEDTDDRAEEEEKPPKPATVVRYNRLDDRLRFANALIAANPADIIIIDSWPEECLMKSTFPALDDRTNDQESYVTKTAYRPGGGRGTMVAMKKRCLLPEDERYKNVGLIGLDRLVKRYWAPTPLSHGGCNQAWIHAVDAGPTCFNHEMQPVRLSIVAYDCGRGYPFQNVLTQNGNSNAIVRPPLTPRQFLNSRSSSFSNNLSDMTQRIAGVRSAIGAYETKTALIRPTTRSNSSVGFIRNGSTENGHKWWRGPTKDSMNGASKIEECLAMTNGLGTQKMRDRKNSLIETRAATPMEEAEERIRIAGELKQLKSFISVSLAKQVGEKRRHVERRASEVSLDRYNQTQVTKGAIALVVGRFGINSLPLSQSMATCANANTTQTSQDCLVSVCDNDRCETMAVVWWRPVVQSNGFNKSNNSSLEHILQPASSSDDIGSTNSTQDQPPISINDATALLNYDRSEWFEAEFECRPRMFTVSFQ